MKVYKHSSAWGCWNCHGVDDVQNIVITNSINTQKAEFELCVDCRKELAKELEKPI